MSESSIINLPQQTITGLLDGSITRVFEVCDPQPVPDESSNMPWVDDGPTPSGLGRMGHSLSNDDNPFGSPGTIHTIGGQQFEVVESGVKQAGQLTIQECKEANQNWFSLSITDGDKDTWLWTAELRRKEENE